MTSGITAAKERLPQTKDMCEDDSAAQWMSRRGRLPHLTSALGPAQLGPWDQAVLPLLPQFLVLPPATNPSRSVLTGVCCPAGLRQALASQAASATGNRAIPPIMFDFLPYFIL